MKMPLKGAIYSQIIDYVAFKLAENKSFQKISLNIHDKIQELHRTSINELINSDSTKVSINKVLNKLIETGKNLFNKS